MIVEILLAASLCYAGESDNHLANGGYVIQACHNTANCGGQGEPRCRTAAEVRACEEAQRRRREAPPGVGQQPSRDSTGAPGEPANRNNNDRRGGVVPGI